MIFIDVFKKKTFIYTMKIKFGGKSYWKEYLHGVMEVGNIIPRISMCFTKKMVL